MSPNEPGSKDAKNKSAGKKQHMKRNASGFVKKGKKPSRNSPRKESKVDKEIKEIEKLESRIQEIAALPDDKKTTITTFDGLPISNYTKLGLKEAGFAEMTDIQKSSIIHALVGRDILGCAKTGSGKTLSFLIPSLERLYRERWDSEDGLGIVVISPVRELAIQIFDVLRTIGKYHAFSAGLIIGGKDFEEEQASILRMNILVATPGRLLQHIEQTPGFDGSTIRVLIIDEVDRCLDMGFKHTIVNITDALGTDRQSFLFSATVNDSLSEISASILSEPLHINVTNDDDFATPKTITQRYIVCELGRKVELLFSFIKSHLRAKTLVFANSRKEVRFLYEAFRLMKPGVPLSHIHGKQKQNIRTYTYYDFLQKEQACLFCTDVAARGLDFPNIDWVVQWDAPEDGESYIHRVGRAGRFRSKGNGLLFLLPSEEQGFLDVMAEFRIPLKRITVNESKTQAVTSRLMEEVSRDTDLNHLAQTAFISYVRSVQLASNKAIFDVAKLPLDSFAESLGLALVPNLSFLKKKRKSQKSYAQQQLEAEMAGEVAEVEAEEESDQELLVATGKSTMSLKEDEVSLPRRDKKRIRIDGYGTSSKRVRYDESGNATEDSRGAKDITEMEESEFGRDKLEDRLDSAKTLLVANEDKDKEREKMRVREQKLQKKIKDKEQLNQNLATPTVILGNEGDEEEVNDEVEE